MTIKFTSEYSLDKVNFLDKEVKDPYRFLCQTYGYSPIQLILSDILF